MGASDGGVVERDKAGNVDWDLRPQVHVSSLLPSGALWGLQFEKQQVNGESIELTIFEGFRASLYKMV